MPLNIDEKMPPMREEIPRAMVSSQKISILIKQPAHVRDARCCVDAFITLGASVSVICLGRQETDAGHWEVRPMLESQAACYTDNKTLARRYHLTWLSLEALGNHLKTADWIIPF